MATLKIYKVGMLDRSSSALSQSSVNFLGKKKNKHLVYFLEGVCVWPFWVGLKVNA